MTYKFNNLLNINDLKSDLLIGSALNGVVYTENSRLHVKGNKMHFIYKPDGAPVGWYARNVKTLDDIFLGVGASPTIELENINIVNNDVWAGLFEKINQ